MRLTKTLMLLAPLLVLTACAGLAPSVKVTPVARPVLVQPDSALLAECAQGVDPGKKLLTQAQTEKLWTADRGSLRTCRRQKAELQKFYHDRDAGLTGTGAVPVPTPRPAI